LLLKCKIIVLYAKGDKMKLKNVYLKVRIGILLLFIISLLSGCSPKSENINSSIPNPPTNLTGIVLSEVRVKLTWEDKSDNELGFIVERKKDGEDWQKIKDIPANITSYIDTGLNPGSKYYYRVKAYNASGNSVYSNEIICNTPIIIGPTNLSAGVTSDGKVRLVWEDNSEIEEGYKIEKEINGSWIEIGSVSSNTNTYIDNNVTSGNTYSYRVKAYYSNIDSEYSNIASVFIPQITNGVDFSLMGFATLGGGTTGGEGGEVVYVNTGVDLQNEINKGGPRIIYVNGTITPENTAGKYVIYVKNVSKISIIGIGVSGELKGVGIKINNANNIVIRNLKIHEVKDPNIATQGPDCITIEGPAKNIWIDHCEFYNQFQGIDKDYYDGLLDINGAVDYVTVSWCYFHDSWKTSLIGSSDSDNYNRTITYHHNWFRNCNSRLPSFRFGEGHIFSNYYQDIPGSAINSRMGAKLKIEHNYFENVKNPIGSWDSQEIGFWDIVGNIFIDCSGSIPTTSTCSYTPPYSYTLTPAEKVKEIVTQYAGVGKIDF